MRKLYGKAAIYCAIFAMAGAVAMSCNDDKGPNKEPGKDEDSTSTSKVASISLFSSDSVAFAESIEFPIEQGAQKVIVDASVKGWTVQIQGNEEGGTAWLACEPALGAAGRTEVSIAVTANIVEIARTGVVTFVQDSTGLTKVVNVSQACPPPLVTDISTDSLALIAMYNAWDGKGLWKDYWDLKKPLDKWQGVTVSLVDGKHRITSLNFENKSAKGDIPEELGNLRALTSLRLIVSRVKGVIPNGLSFAKGMKHLYIRGSLLITGLPKDLGLWTELETLDIASTSVAEIPESLGKCAKLRELNAAPMNDKMKEPIKGNINTFLANKPELRFACFGDTGLTGDLSFIKQSPLMNKFETLSNLFSGDLNLIENLAGADSLEYLILDSSPNMTGTLEGLSAAKSLAALRIKDSKVGGSLDLAQMHLLPKMSSIWLLNNEFTGNLSMEFLSGCRTANNVSMNKLSGTLSQEVKDVLKAKFQGGDRVCVQKDGFGFDNCDLP